MAVALTVLTDPTCPNLHHVANVVHVFNHFSQPHVSLSQLDPSPFAALGLSGPPVIPAAEN